MRPIERVRADSLHAQLARESNALNVDGSGDSEKNVVGQ